MCKLQAGDRRCNPACNTPSCRYDGGDCRGVPTGGSSSIGQRPSINDLFNIGRRLAPAKRPPADSYSYDSYSYEGSYDEDDGWEPPQRQRQPAREEESDSDEEEEDGPPPSFVQRATDQVIAPLLALIGTFGGIGALCSLCAGLLAVCGAASSSTTLLRASAGTRSAFTPPYLQPYTYLTRSRVPAHSPLRYRRIRRSLPRRRCCRRRRSAHLWRRHASRCHRGRVPPTREPLCQANRRVRMVCRRLPPRPRRQLRHRGPRGCMRHRRSLQARQRMHRAGRRE